jgi:hypothetical protein
MTAVLVVAVTVPVAAPPVGVIDNTSVTFQLLLRGVPTLACVTAVTVASFRVTRPADSSADCSASLLSISRMYARKIVLFSMLVASETKTVLINHYACANPSYKARTQ